MRLQRCNSMAKRRPQRTFQAENLAWATLGLRVAVYIGRAHPPRDAKSRVQWGGIISQPIREIAISNFISMPAGLCATAVVVPRGDAR